METKKDMGKFNKGWVVDGKWYHEECFNMLDEHLRNMGVLTVSEINNYCHKCHEKMTRMSVYINTLEGEIKQEAIQAIAKYEASDEYPAYVAESIRLKQEYLDSLEE